MTPDRDDTSELYNRGVAAPRPVLCVEDNDANFALIKLVLEKTGLWAVSRANDATQARDAIAGQRPDVVLLDLDLPGVSGLELARELKASKDWSTIPIIVVSASVMRQEHDRAREVGCEFFLEKPFDIGVLRSTVAQAAAAGAGPVS
ncbi:Phosphate regulon transcriptional regulatory protein PhoB (SphR) [Enhygromyxa salina]|uniref:Phosphate regulon transcriptional regulatory protein PhoB (SphR) n=1 Tax=Enhygromyxa salina TaxID=215803 RepID=A0A0C1Z5L7_9BACT|nr:response regulator [Enhygromyxa salina]KIG12899.1 Phosphate regulon transcriptional regulatory protein PhoB (SphR) [Enhygromyxa salina]